MAPDFTSPVSELSLHWGNGDRKALEVIMPLVYEELRRLARATRLSLDDHVVAAPASSPDVDLLALDAALNKLAKLDTQQTRIIELRYFAGLSIDDAAKFLGISPATVKRSWTSARAWLLREMDTGGGKA